MYIPAFNGFPDKQEAISFMRRYSFATMVTDVNGVPGATHLPFLIKQENDKLFLLSHFAKANPHSAQILDKISLVIFTEPHAYITPKLYGKEESVPTWNYIAIHAYGNARILDDEEQKAGLLQHTIKQYDTGYLKQYEKLPNDFKSKMMKGIVAFEIEVTDLQAKKKLSQNRSEVEQQNIIHSLENSSGTNEREIAEYMKKLKH